MASLNGHAIHGYEIHMGSTKHAGSWLQITTRNGRAVQQPDGAVSEDGRVWGCYLHGLFANRSVRQTWLKSLGWQPAEGAGADKLANSFSLLADTLETSLDMQLLERIVWEN
jgi:adenosylcobyric acid synthase